MKKWSIITSVLVVGALAIAAFATVGAASAATNPYEPVCPPGEQGTPPYCHKTPGGGGGGGGTTEPPKTCPAGQVGTYPNCVTPALRLKKLKVTNTKAVATVWVNAPGTLVASGNGLYTSKPRTVSSGSYNLTMKLKKGKRKQLSNTGKVKVSVKILYSPTGASPITKRFTISFKAKPPKHHSKHGKK